MKNIFLLFILISPLFSQVDIEWQVFQNPVSNGELNGSNGFSSFYVDNNGILYIIGNLADNYISKDLGENWIKLTDTRSFFDMQSLNDGRLICQLNNQAFISDDSAATWQELDIPPYLNRIFAQDEDGTLWLGADGGLVHKNNLDGPWKKADGVDGRVWAFSSYEDKYLAGTFNIGFDEDEFGTKGELFHSDDNGLNWEQNALLSSDWYENAIFFDENTVVVSIRKEGGTAKAFRTSNGGNSWESVPLNDVNVGFTKINDNMAFAMLANSGPFLTTDKGKTWQPVISGLNSATNRFVMPVRLHKDGYALMSDMTGRTWRTKNKIDLEYVVKPYAPVLSYPENNSVLESAATLEWNNIENAEYEIAISKDANFENEDIYQSSENKLNIDNFEIGKNYFWKVRSISDGVKGPWSFTWNFKIDGTNGINQIKEVEEIYYSDNIIYANNLKSDLQIFDILGNKINSFNKGYSGRIFNNEINGIYFINYNGKAYKINSSNN